MNYSNTDIRLERAMRFHAHLQSVAETRSSIESSVWRPLSRRARTRSESLEGSVPRTAKAAPRRSRQ